ncbi:alpha/beta fold hydrolase [Rathayibacter soli]|uniref:alpha/beta fold hydrolase n=1 Tax=Rathayibacter soli TaxID=3144168 RepID=UPI0027E48F8F|nr:alpha/beta hydrolase [Glaciibacter superstes]
MSLALRAVVFASIAAGVALVGGCAAHAPDQGGTGVSFTAAPSASPGTDFARPVDIPGGRRLYLECRGSGSPTVVLISGTGGAADEWMSAVATADPAAPPTPSTQSVFDTLARTGRVCAYDRPGTTLMSGAPDRSTSVAQPTTALQDVVDLQALLTAAGEPGPYVLVGASWGGMIAQQFARQHPGETKGIVLVDAASVYLKSTLTPMQWSNWMATNATAHAKSPDAESPDYETSVAELQAGAVAPRIPAAVLSSDRPWDLGVTPGASTWPAWTQAQELLAHSLDATHITDTHSGHGIAVEQPALVATAIRQVVERVR